MDDEKLKRRQSFKVIISEFIMVITVIVTVIILAFVVSGYWLNADLEIERQGMIQVSSIPTGADLNIDGVSSWLQRTNTSKILASGEHTVTVSKEGYDTWTKTVNISEGLLYRLHYPRLFLQNRETEKVLDARKYTIGSVSPDRDKLLLIGDTTEWQIANLKRDYVELRKLDIANFFSGISLADGATTGLFTDTILDLDWDRDGRHVLVKASHEGGLEWVLIDVENPKNSLNLSREFSTDFSEVKILDNSSSNLLALRNGNMHKIDVPGKLISAVLAKGVNDFDHFENEIVFSATKTTLETEATPETESEPGTKPYYIGLFKLGDENVTELRTSSTPLQVTISKFYDEMYITTLDGDRVELFKEENFTPVQDYTLSFTPTKMEVGHNGEFITMLSGSRLATLDMEITSIREWSLESASFGWIDNDMIYVVSDGELIVYDFDGYNRRIIARNVSDHFPVAISDNKWLYYFSDNNLIREKLTK